MRRTLGLAIMAAVIASTPALAEGMPPDIAARIAAIGRVIDVPKTAAIYAPMHQKAPFSGIKMTRPCTRRRRFPASK